MFVVDEKEPSYGNGRKESILEKKREWGKEGERLSERKSDYGFGNSLHQGWVKARNDRSMEPADQRDCESLKNKKDKLTKTEARFNLRYIGLPKKF